MRAQKISWLAILVVSSLCACKKEKVGQTGDSIPIVPIVVQNAMAFRPDPTVSTSKNAGGAIQIILTVPAESGRTIKEITKVAASTTYTQIQSSASSGFYTSAPIPVNGLTATFNTTLAEYVVKGPGTIPSTTNVELAKRFYFLLTMDDGSTIVTTPVRVLVLD